MPMNRRTSWRIVHTLWIALMLCPLLAATANPALFLAAQDKTGLIVALIQGQQYDQAISEARRVISNDPKSSKAHALLGFALESLGKLSPAQEAYRKAVELNPAFVMPRLQLGVLYGKQKRHKDCIAMLEAVRGQIEDDPEALFYLSQAYFEEGVGLEQQHPVDGGTLLSIGNLLLAREELEPAARILGKAAAIKADSFLAHYGLGVALYQLGRYDSAVKALDRALIIDPNSGKAQQVLAMALLQTGSTARAEHLLRAVLLTDPANAHAYSLLGQLMLQQKSYDESVHLLQKAIQLSPGKPEYEFELAEAYHSKGDSQKAQLHGLRLLQLFPDHPGSHLNVGSSLKLAGDFEQAQTHLRKCLEMARPEVSSSSFRRSSRRSNPVSSKPLLMIFLAMASPMSPSPMMPTRFITTLPVDQGLNTDPTSSRPETDVAAGWTRIEHA